MLRLNGKTLPGTSPKPRVPSMPKSRKVRDQEKIVTVEVGGVYQSVVKEYILRCHVFFLIGALVDSVRIKPAKQEAGTSLVLVFGSPSVSVGTPIGETPVSRVEVRAVAQDNIPLLFHLFFQLFIY